MSTVPPVEPETSEPALTTAPDTTIMVVPAASSDAGHVEVPIVVIPDAPALAASEVIVTDDAAEQEVPSQDLLVAALQDMRQELRAATFPFAVDTRVADQAGARSAGDQLDDYILPRVQQVDAPVLAVVGGSTGAGKSTLVNSLLRQTVSQPGVLRPTTRSPILVHHPDDAAWFADDRILPHLARLRSDGGTLATGRKDAPITTVQLVQTTALPPGMALLDAPDIDSVVAANRDLASQLLAAADLWIFVTSAARYADAVPWALLNAAGQRGASVAMVLDRVPPAALHEVRNDLASMLSESGLENAPLFAIEESQLEDGLLPETQVAPLREWVTELAADAVARQVVVRKTLAGALDDIERRATTTAQALQRQVDVHDELERAVTASYASATERVSTSLSDGTLMRGEVLARWQQFVGAGELMRTLESQVGRVRDRIAAFLTGRSRPVEPLGEAVQTGVSTVVLAELERAVDATVKQWRATQAGRELLAAHPELADVADDAVERSERLVREWQRSVFDLVRTEGEGKRTQARIVSLGVNALGLVLMVVIFAGTAFIPTGLEVAAAFGSAAAGQALLEAIFGEQAVRNMAKRARADLEQRVNALLQADENRFTSVLATTVLDLHSPARLQSTVERVRAAR